MAVPKEDITEYIGRKIEVDVVELRRNASGDWTLVLNIEKYFDIDGDGVRQACFNGEVRIKGRQSGIRARKK